MNIIKRNIPNFITILNLFSGLLSIIFILNGKIILASYLIFLGSFLDLFDGLLARYLNIRSELGKQLDSIADMVTFGVAPAMIIFQLIYYSQTSKYFQGEFDYIFLTSICGLIYSIFVAIRLAKYNIDDRQENIFIGLPTPASALTIASLPFIDYFIITNTLFIIITSLFISLLMISNIKLFSLKKNKEVQDDKRLKNLKLILVSISFILLFVFKYAAIPFIVILYILLSLINNHNK